ncbi:DUF4189 domain-containing protein [Dyella sp.]|uniref:DUF4189 domain-containing protein n=1 Tax=Dyella sp. TaxID=1869338 RepID=UPI0039C8970A
MAKKYCYLIFISLWIISNSTFSQCAPGIPGAGNPGCVPPDVPGSPGGQHGHGAQSPAQAIWKSRWGAIAYDKDTDRISLSSGEKSKRVAVKKVMKNCEEKGGKQCRLVFAYHNQCAAIASNEGKISYGTGPYKNIAEDLVMKNCKKTGSCELIYSKCSYAERVD